MMVLDSKLRLLVLSVSKSGLMRRFETQSRTLYDLEVSLLSASFELLKVEVVHSQVPLDPTAIKHQWDEV